MKKTISLILSAVMLLSVILISAPAFAGNYVDDAEARGMLSLVNSFRQSNEAWYWNETDTKKISVTGLSGLQYDENLEKIAKIRAEELVQNFAHERPDGTKCFTCTATDANGETVSTYGENIAKGVGMTAEQAFVCWREDDEKYDGQGHRRNMLSSIPEYPDAHFTCIGIAGFVGDDGCTYWVQEFGYILSAQKKSEGKKANTLSAKGKTVTVKKSKKTVIKKAKAFTIKDAKGAVTFKKSSGNKKITVSKAGKITVNKGLKKGTYKIKVKVTAAGNSSYNKKTVTVTVTIKVK